MLKLSRKQRSKIGDRTINNSNSRSRDRVFINEYIRAREVRLIDEKGENHGIVPTSKALKMAQAADLDLVLISPAQNPPVAKILDYGKYKYEQTKKAKEAKKKQKIVEIKEVKMRYKIDTHDYDVRLKNAKKFISQGNKVKLVIMLRGREMQHSKLAFDLANKFIENMLEDEGNVVLEKKPQLEGRNVTCYLTGQTQN